jgi:TonB family protein
MSAQTRTGGALLLSTLAHAVLLGALLLTVRLHPALGPLQVRLLKLPPAARLAEAPGEDEEGRAPALEAQAAPLASAQAERKRPLPARAQVQPLLAPDEMAAPAVTTAPSLSAAEAAAGLAPEGSGVSAANPAGLASGGAATGLSGVGHGTGGGSRLAELHRRLAEAAARCYPASARRFRLKGEVPLHFCLDAQGTPSALSLEGSTGSALLDNSALECVVPGAQPLAGFEGCFLVPVRFGS